MKYLVSGASLVNNLVFTDGRKVTNILGGCGFYAYCGCRFYEKDSLFISGLGEDYNDYYGPWFDKNEVSRDGIVIAGKRTKNTILTYDENGDYTEVSAFSDEEMLSDSSKAICADDVIKHIGPDTKGMYLFGQWQNRLGGCYEAAHEKGVKVMWEVTPVTYLGIEEYYDEFMDYVEKCDIYSFNRFEAFVIFHVDSDEEVIKKIQEIGKPCFYRIGTEGAYMVTKDECYKTPMISVVPREEEVDPTGCGNSSTAAAMWAFVEGYDPIMIAFLSSVCSAYNVRQYGPWQDMSEEVKAEAIATAKKLADEYKANLK